MFSTKEYALVALELAFSILYFICQLCMMIDSKTAELVSIIVVFFQIIPFVLYTLLTFIHIKMLYLSAKFMKRSVEGDFKQTFTLLKYSEMITVLCVFWVFLFSIDISTFINIWADYPAAAAKLTFFPYWLTCDISYRWTYAIMWFLPYTVFTVILELVTYSKYYKAKKRFTFFYPSVDVPNFYNAFISARRKERHTLIIPKDNLEEIEVPPDDRIPPTEKNEKEPDPSSPLGKNLGNNSLYVVDPELLNNKRRNTYKTQAEIDAEDEYGRFFGREEGTDTMISFFPKRKANIDKQSQEYSRIQILNEMGNVQPEDLKPKEQPRNSNTPYDSEIPLDFDYQSFYRNDPKEKEQPKKEEHKEEYTLITCPFCGTVNPDDRDECIFCGASIESEKKKELVSCPFCGTINPDDRGECIFCGAELAAKSW
ncbi:MAG: hypothetical protein HDT44_07130 [Ruminococcaceae bacterium]|nr:hypothetical protein [Oscillospiraceae bacterium]